MVRLTNHPAITLAVDLGRKATKQNSALWRPCYNFIAKLQCLNVKRESINKIHSDLLSFENAMHKPNV